MKKKNNQSFLIKLFSEFWKKGIHLLFKSTKNVHLICGTNQEYPWKIVSKIVIAIPKQIIRERIYYWILNTMDKQKKNFKFLKLL